MKWTTITTYIDTETGEVLSKKQIEKGHYVKLNTVTTYRTTSKDYGIKYQTWKCEKNRQTRLEI